MEELKPVQTTPPLETLNPTTNPDPSDTGIHNLPSHGTNKRPLNQNDQIPNSTIFKMRAMLKGLRPHFIEAIKSPVIHDCQAAAEIRQQMKVLMDLYKEIIAETVSGENENGEKRSKLDHEHDVKMAVPAPEVSEKESWEDAAARGTYIVGGSAFGWNFVTYVGTTKSEYYGRTKEMFRSAANVVKE